MSASSTLLSSGFSVLLSVSGEALTYEGNAVTGIVDRVGYVGGQRSPDFSARDMSRVEILANALGTEPEVGKAFTDEDGIVHRIQAMKRVGIGLLCECKVQA